MQMHGHRSGVPANGVGGRGLFSEDFLHVSGFLLSRAFHLIRFAFGFKAFVADQFAGAFLDLAFDIFAGSFYLILFA